MAHLDYTQHIKSPESKGTHNVFVTLGASNHSKSEREENDYYATPPVATKALLEMMKKHNILQFAKKYINIYEPCVGQGHIAQILAEDGYNVYGSDLIVREQPINAKYKYINESCNFFSMGQLSKDIISQCYDDSISTKFDIHKDINIITNPPYGLAQECVEHALDIVQNNSYVIMFLKIQFLEGLKRYKLFKENPPEYVFICSERMNCAPGGDFENNPETGGSIAFAWYVWKKGFKGLPQIDWISPSKKLD